MIMIKIRMMTISFWIAGALSAVAAEEDKQAARVSLGRQLFMELRFTHPGTNVQSSCGGCHIPPDSPRPGRLFADFEPASVVPHRSADDRRLTTLNTPTLLDAGAVATKDWRHNAGPFASLEEMIAETIVGRDFGWLPGERAEALDNMDAILVGDTGEGRPGDGAYVDQFKAAYGIDIEASAAEANLKAVAGAIADYVRTIQSTRTSAYDAFVEVNRINRGPGKGEEPLSYAGRIFGRLANQEARLLLKRPGGFSAEAFEGFKVFFRTEGPTSVGSCVTCHTPPDFSDHKFHVKGVCGAEPGRAVRTPTLRGINRTGPYLSDGSAKTIEAAVRATIAAAEAARAGALPNADPALKNVKIEEDDVSKLVAFIETLSDLDKKGFRDSLIAVEQHQPVGANIDEELELGE